MIFGFITELAVGLLCVILGLVIWLRRKASLIHEYHYKNVKEADLPAYTRLVGISLIVIGGGIIVTGFLNLAGSPFWWIPLVPGFLAGFLVMNRAQKKYNGSWFG